MHLQIRQASLLPNLLINATSVEWLPVPYMEVSDTKTVEGLDYHKMTFEKRALDLDDLRVTSGYVLTGKIYSNLEKRLLESPLMLYNYNLLLNAVQS